MLLRSISMLAVGLFWAHAGYSQTAGKTDSLPDPKLPLLQVEASCGSCQLGLKGADCLLAIRWEGKAYLVTGTGIDDHGDAHAKDGFCNAVRRAQVQGAVKEGKFVATYFKLLPLSVAKPGSR